jgi:hypothetical protein
MRAVSIPIREERRDGETKRGRDPVKWAPETISVIWEIPPL